MSVLSEMEGRGQETILSSVLVAGAACGNRCGGEGTCMSMELQEAGEASRTLGWGRVDRPDLAEPPKQ